VCLDRTHEPGLEEVAVSDAPLLEPEEIQKVLSDDERTSVAPDAATGRVLPYSLRDPVVLPPEAEPEAKQRLADLAAALSSALTEELGEAIGLEVDGFQQHRAGAALEALPKPAWVLAFVGRQPGGIALALPAAVGLALVERALGAEGGALPDVSREPTPLESQLLGRLGSSVAASVARAARAELSGALLCCGSPPASLASPGETVGVGVGRIRLGGAERSVLFLASPALLGARRESPEEGDTGAPGPLAGPLRRIRLHVRPVLRGGTVRISELAGLEAGAVLRLEPSEQALFELRIEGRTVFLGQIRPHEKGPAFVVARRFDRVPSLRRKRS